jgi:hypothetical protein
MAASCTIGRAIQNFAGGPVHVLAIDILSGFASLSPDIVELKVASAITLANLRNRVKVKACGAVFSASGFSSQSIPKAGSTSGRALKALHGSLLGEGASIASDAVLCSLAVDLNGSVASCLACVVNQAISERTSHADLAIALLGASVCQSSLRPRAEVCAVGSHARHAISNRTAQGCVGGGLQVTA